MNRFFNYGYITPKISFTDYINCVKFESVKLQNLTQKREEMVAAFKDNNRPIKDVIDISEAYLALIQCLFAFMGKYHAQHSSEVVEEDDLVIKGKGKKAVAMSKDELRLFKLVPEYTWTFPISKTTYSSTSIHLEIAAVLFFTAIAKFETQFTLGPCDQAIVADVLSVVKNLQEAAGLFSKCAEISAQITNPDAKGSMALPYDITPGFLNSMSQLCVGLATFYFLERFDIENDVYKKDVCQQEEITRPLSVPHALSYKAFMLMDNTIKTISIELKRGQFCKFLECMLALAEIKYNIATADYYSLECDILYTQTFENKDKEGELRNAAKFSAKAGIVACEIFERISKIKVSGQFDDYFCVKYESLYKRCEDKKNNIITTLNTVYNLGIDVSSHEALPDMPRPKLANNPVKAIEYSFIEEEELAWKEIILGK